VNEPFEVEQLLGRLRTGDQQALGNLFALYRPRLQRMVELRLDPRMTARLDASDVLQEAYLDASQQAAAYLESPRVACYVWLRGLTWQRLIKLQRQHLGARRRATELEVSLPAGSSAVLASQLLDRGPCPGEAVLQEELRQRVQRALTLLQPTDQEIILLRDFEGLSNHEAAQTLGIADSAATMRYGRALVRLREVLTAEWPSGESRP